MVAWFQLNEEQNRKQMGEGVATQSVETTNFEKLVPHEGSPQM